MVANPDEDWAWSGEAPLKGNHAIPRTLPVVPPPRLWSFFNFHLLAVVTLPDREKLQYRPSGPVPAPVLTRVTAWKKVLALGSQLKQLPANDGGCPRTAVGETAFNAIGVRLRRPSKPRLQAWSAVTTCGTSRGCCHPALLRDIAFPATQIVSFVCCHATQRSHLGRFSYRSFSALPRRIMQGVADINFKLSKGW